jgi:hypothetical protein
MQQRQLRLGDILDDYCPRERRVTNHAVVAMVGPDVKQTRCTTCDAEHDYKHAKVPRQRRKNEPAALYSQVAAGAPKRVRHDAHPSEDKEHIPTDAPHEPAEADVDAPEKSPDSSPSIEAPFALGSESAGESDEPQAESPADDEELGADDGEREQGPVHRPLIRASLPRPEGQPPPARPLPEFTVRQPGARPANRFRTRPQRSAQPFPGNRSGAGPVRGGGMPRQGGSRPPQTAIPSRPGRRHGPGRKRSK